MRVAVASQDLTRIDAHFGWARHLVLFEVSAEGHHLLRTHVFPGVLRQDGNSRKLAAKIAAVNGCSLVFAKDIGEEAISRLNRIHARAVCSFGDRPLAEALDSLTARLRHRPPRWLRMEEQRHRRFNSLGGLEWLEDGASRQDAND